MTYTMGSLFAGIGGFDLGFERAGFKTSWQVEIDPYCQKVLAKNFPEAERFGDIRECGRHNLKPVDVICGGFPCQDISWAGFGAGIDGDRSGLWSEMYRVIGELRPHFVLVENVSALLDRGMGRVLGDLAEIGYDAEWDCIPAAAVGAPTIRDRVWILAYPGQEHRRRGYRWKDESGSTRGLCLPQGDDGFASERREDRELVALVSGIHPRVASDWWLHQSRMDRTADGIRGQLDARNGALGNSVVPQIPTRFAEYIKQQLNFGDIVAEAVTK